MSDAMRAGRQPIKISVQRSWPAPKVPRGGGSGRAPRPAATDRSDVLLRQLHLHFPLAQIIVGGAPRCARRPIRIEIFLRNKGNTAIIAHPDEVDALG